MNELTEYMDRYFSNELSAEEKEIFENRIISDPVFAEEFAIYVTINEHVKQQWYNRRKQELTALAQDIDVDSRSLALREIDEILNTVYIKYFQRDATPDHPPESLGEAFDYYNMEEYEEAIDAFNQIDTDNLVVTRGSEENQEQATFYKFYFKGLSQMEESKFEEAIAELDIAVTKSTDSYSKSKAQWYLALAYVKTNEKEKAEALLKLLAENDNALEYKERALQMINDLKKGKPGI